MTSFICLPFANLSAGQLYDIMALRQTVFVVEQQCAYLDADGKDQPAWHLIGSNQSRQTVSYARLLPVGVSYDEHASIGRVVVDPAYRNQGIGMDLMNQALRWTRHLFPGAPVKISAQSHLKDFYERFGFSVCGAEYLEDGIPHLPMHTC
ncbi:MAG: hypothetical protein RLY31_2952 [Bacteroidota bacterium]|jgi:ElaA protein